VDIAAAVVRDFYRPAGRQVRLVDARPLAHHRAADDTVASDPDWSEAIAQAVSLSRVCPEDDASGCDGRPGGALRFSFPYAVDADSATIFVRYTPLDASGAQSPDLAGELRFEMVRDAGVWRIANRVTVVAPGGR
jgi:hypothetical protein